MPFRKVSIAGRSFCRFIPGIGKYTFLDTDEIIEKAAGMTIPEIFDAEGEEGFRQVEGQVLDSVHPYVRCVISTGGGIVCRMENWSKLQTGLVVWLDVAPELIMKRIEGTDRPLLQTEDPLQTLKDLLEERKDKYANADIRIEVTEDMDPDHLSQIINQYLDVITEEFLTAGATVDKIVGDAVFGFFGAPIPDDDHANKAIDLSFRLQHASKKFQERMKQDGIEFGNTRIGVSTGTAIVGNFGGQRFFDYSAFGDVVNTASRLEGANKSIGTDICVCDNTRMRADRHIFRPVGMLKLAGKEIAIKAWEPMKPTKTSKLERDAYMEAYTLLASSKNRSALDAFEVLDQKWPNDPLVAFHLERLNQNQNGVEVELKK